MTRIILIACGLLATGLGIVGIVLPVMPTTPFLLLAAACFVRSSPRLYQWLLNNRLFGDYIRRYREGRGIPLRVKVPVLLLLWATITYSVWAVVEVLWLRVLLVAIAAAVTVHILTIGRRAKK